MSSDVGGGAAGSRDFPQISQLLKRLGSLICFAGLLVAQDGGGQSEIGFQRYYLSVDSHSVADINGVTLGFTQFIPGFGVISASAVPALSDNHFRTGDDFFKISGLPWEGQHWNFTIGDFRAPGQLIRTPFTNLWFPEIAARGFSAEASHGGRTIGFFFGGETIANTPRIVLRQAVPQSVQGFYIRQKVGERLLLGARFMHYSTDLAALQSFPGLLMQGNPIQRASTVSVDGLYRIAGPLKWYTDITWTAARQQFNNPGARNVPFSTLSGPLWETDHVKVRANYTIESAAYLPLLGYYLGDRQGPFAEATVTPNSWLSIYGSASGYRNNLAHDPTLSDVRSSGESAGVSFKLPAQFSLSGQFTYLDLSGRTNAASAWDPSKNQQKTVSVARPIGSHSLGLYLRDFTEVSRAGLQHQRAAEVQDTFRIKRFTLGGGVRVQRFVADSPYTTLYFHGLASARFGPLSLYANIDQGNDLQNRTLFATNTVSTSVAGAALNLGKHWELQAEAFRNRLVTELNPESVFVLQGQGVFIPGTLSALNQWSLYFRVNRKFSWGKAGAATDIGQYGIARVPLKGAIEGFVMEQVDDRNRGVEGIAVTIDGDRTINTDEQGRFRFIDVPEGVHKVSLFTQELAADFDPGPNKERTVMVAPNRSARADLDVVRLVMIQGKVIGPPGASLDNIEIRIAPGGRYTTPDGDGNFYFYDLREGQYKLAVDEKTLPQYAVLGGPGTADVSIVAGHQPEPVIFDFQIREPSKPVRQVAVGQARPAAATSPSAPASPPAKGIPAMPAAQTAQATAAQPAVEAGPVTRRESAQKHNLAGRKLSQAGRYQEAIVELSEAIRLNPKFALAYNARGYAWYQIHAYVNAVQDLDEAIRLDPNYANAYHIRALARSAMRTLKDDAGTRLASQKAETDGKPEEPENPGPNRVSANRPTRANPGVVRLSMIQGKVIGSPGARLENITIRLAPRTLYTSADASGNFYFYDLPEGAYTLSILEKSLPSHSALREQNSQGVTITAGRQPEPVIFHLDAVQAAKAEPAGADAPSGSAAPLMASSHGQAASAESAAPARKTAAATVPASARRHYVAARKLLEGRRFQEAINELNTAIRLNAKFAPAYNARGYAWFQLHKFGSAIQDLDRAVQLDPRYVNALHIRALAEAAKGDLRAAESDNLRVKQLTASN